MKIVKLPCKFQSLVLVGFRFYLSKQLDRLEMYSVLQCFLEAEDVVKNYLGLRNKRNDQNHERIEKCKEWLVDVSVPTASSDYLWDDFIRNNHKNVGKYLASPDNAQKSSLKKRRNNENEEGIEILISN